MSVSINIIDEANAEIKANDLSFSFTVPDKELKKELKKSGQYILKGSDIIIRDQESVIELIIPSVAGYCETALINKLKVLSYADKDILLSTY